MSEIFPQPRITLNYVSEYPQDMPSIEFVFSTQDNDLVHPGKKLGTVRFDQGGKNAGRFLISLGEKENVTTQTYFKAAAAFSRWTLTHTTNKCYLGVHQSSINGNIQILRAVFEGLTIGGFDFTKYKTKNLAEISTTQITIVDDKNIGLLAEIQRAVIVGESMDLARNWIREPANSINPQTLEDRARESAEKFNLTIKVVQYDELLSMGAGGIAAVGRGSQVKPRLIIMEYQNGGTAKPCALIGKAITFDTGGYSLKGTDFIKGMKYDKAGGITVLAAIIAAARLKIKANIVAVIPAAENMISGDAYRPDDILKMLSGLTVEISSTDAEGRLILADALTYTQTTYHPQVILDIATLTGGVVVALGNIRAGLLSNSDNLANIIFEKGERNGERVWRLPMDKEYVDLIHSDDADMKNSGSKQASSIVGGIFLKQFVDDSTDWAHLDIAGTGESENETLWHGKGPTGFGVRLLLDTIEDFTH